MHQALDARLRDRTDGLKNLLAEWADKEVADIMANLKELEAAIRGQLNDPLYHQGSLPGFSPAEQEQFERNVEPSDAGSVRSSARSRW
jgi:hypothetical protein